MTLQGEYVGQLSFYGQGAGRYPTAHSLVEDILDIAEGRAARSAAPALTAAKVDNSVIKHKYYVRGADLSFLKGVSTEPMGDGVVTEPVAVARMHEMLQKALNAGGSVFLAAFAG